MLNLFRSQKQAVKLFLGAILTMVAVSMVITLIPGSLNAPVDANTQVLAEVGDRELTSQDVQGVMSDYFRSGQINTQTVKFLAQQVVDNKITDLVLLEEAEELGLSAGEEELAEWLKGQMPFLFQNGVFLGPDQYRAFVTQRFQKSVPQFEEEVRRSLVVDVRLRRMVTDNIVVTNQELQEIYQAQNEKTKVEFVKLQSDDFRSAVKPTQEQLKEFFESRKQQYRIPEMRSLKLMTIDDSRLPEIELSENEIERYYRQNRQRFEVSERIRASHILFMTEGKSEEEKAALEKKAQDVLAQIKQGADFAEMAKKYSEDPGTAPKGGDLGWILRGQMVPNFEKESFALKPGEISDVITTQYGFHIIKVHERQEGHTQAIEEVRDEIRQDLTQDRQSMTRMKLVDQTIATARKFGNDMESAGQQLNLPVTTVEKVKRTDQPAELQGLGNLLVSVFGAGEGEVVTSNQEDKTAVAVVTKIIPSRQAEMDEVRDQVREQYVVQEARKLAQERAKQLAEKARERKGNLKAAARQYRLKTKTSDFVTRADSIPDLGAAQVLGEEAFRGASGTIVGPVNAGGDWAVYRVVEHQPADMLNFEEKRGKLLEKEQNRKQEEIFNIYKAAARKRYEEEGRVKRYQTRIDNYIQALARSG